MIKLKGGDDKHSIMNAAAQRMGLPTANSSGKGKKGSSAIPEGPTPLAERLGLPSASSKPSSAAATSGGSKSSKDWSLQSNRINLGAPVYIKSKSRAQDEEVEVREKARKLGDVTAHSDDEEEEEEGEEGVLAALRAQRMVELKKNANKQQEWMALGHGQYLDIEQDGFLKAVTSSKYVICHFFQATFERCKIVDHHLGDLCKSHLPTRFIKIDAEKAPFFVQKLQIKVLPSIVCFKDGIAVDRVIGFEDLGAVDDFETGVLEKRLAKSGCLIAKEEETSKAKDLNYSSIRASRLTEMMNEDIDNIDDEFD